MRFDTLVWHYTATFEDQDIGVAEVDRMHRARGFREIGYHGLIRLNGVEEKGRSETRTGAHVGGQNTGKLGYVTVGGLRRATGKDVGHDTRTRVQIATQIEMTRRALERYPTIRRVVGHKDLAKTQCPAYDVAAWWASVTGGRVPPGLGVQSDAPAVTRTPLRRGSRGKEVRALQEALKIAGFDPGGIDGLFGPATERALRGFQLHAGLRVTGRADNATWMELLK